jgi:hypothetical protein
MRLAASAAANTRMLLPGPYSAEGSTTMSNALPYGPLASISSDCVLMFIPSRR